MHPRQRKALALALLFALSACQTSAPTNGNGDEAHDTTAPEIVSVTPAAGATGVTHDANIAIVFSEPMDAASVEAAYASSSPGIQPGEVSFTWENDGATLVIVPNAPLAYSPDDTYLTYTFTLAATATDEAGNPLAGAYSGSFSTMRTLTTALTANLSGEMAAPGNVSARYATEFVGVVDDPNTPLCYRAFFSFPLDGLPPGLEEVVSGRLTLYATAHNDAARAGDYRLDHVDFGAELDGDDYGAPFFVDATRSSLLYLIKSGETVTDVTAWTQDAFAAGAERFQVRVRVDECNYSGSGDVYGYYINGARAAQNLPELTLVYHAP